MITLRSKGYAAAFLAASAVSFIPGRASAGTCSTDADCSKGLTCQVAGETACPTYACPAGATCPEQPPCNPTVTKACMPGPCNVDSDCGDGMVCYTDTQKSCEATPPPAPSCPPNTKCDPLPPPPPAPPCTITTEKLCVPRYLLPCAAASDCGPGFACVPDGCGCASGGGVAAADAGVALPGNSGSGPAPAPSTTGTAPLPDPLPSGGCTCTSTTNHCEAQIVDCSTNADCPTGWTCTQSAPTVGTTCAIGVYPDGGTTTPLCPPMPMPPPTMECAPPYSDVIHGAGDFGGLTTVPQAGSTNGSAGSTGAAGSSNAGIAGMPANSDSNANGVGSASSQDSGGCQIGHGSSAASASWLALAGLVGLARRRRRRSA